MSSAQKGFSTRAPNTISEPGNNPRIQQCGGDGEGSGYPSSCSNHPYLVSAASLLLRMGTYHARLVFSFHDLCKSSSCGSVRCLVEALHVAGGVQRLSGCQKIADACPSTFQILHLRR